MRVLKGAFPILRWIGQYNLKAARGDLMAGVTVGVMLVPQGMAYALLAGMPPIYGLYTAILPLLIYPIFGSSRHLAVGTMAIDSIIVAVGVGALAMGDEGRYIELALLLALMVGVIHTSLGVARLGFLVNLLSHPVIVGFTSAAVLIIGFSQLGNLLGIDLPRTQQIHLLVYGAARAIGSFHLVTAAVGIGGIILLLLMKRWTPKLPSAFLVVILGTMVAWGLQLESVGVGVVGMVPEGLPGFKLPALGVQALSDLFPTAIALALIQLANVFALGKVFAARHRYDINANQELIAIGAANMMGSLFQSYPISGSYTRSAVNEMAGGQTALANVFAALLVMVTLLFMTKTLYHIPKAILAALIIVAVLGMFDPQAFKRLYVIKRTDGIIAMLTFCVTLVLGIQNGILTGILLSIAGLTYRISRAHIAVLGHLPGTRSFRDISRNPETHPIEGILILRMDASFTYVNAERLKEVVLRHINEADYQAIILDASTMNDLDTTAVQTLHLLIDALQARGIELFLTGIHGKVMSILELSGLREQLGPEHLTLSPHRAVTRFLASRDELHLYSADQVPSSEAVSDASSS